VLETTFLGHQGWQFATARTRILVDPLLVEEFGHRGGLGLVYPPRVLDMAAMAPVDAIVLTHEHEDHFNIPSLNRVSRKVPIYVPELTSSALKQILRDMQFTVHTLRAGQTVEWSDLHLTVFAPDHVQHDEQDEWETTPFLVLDTSDGASFFSPVDVTVSALIESQLRHRGIVPGLWGYANNVMNMSFQERPARGGPATLPIVTRFFLEHARRPPPTIASLMCGGGFSFTGRRAWMNNLFFPLDSHRLFEGLQQLSPEQRFIAVEPGMQLVTDRSSIVSTSQAPFLRTPPREQWPDRTYAPDLARPESAEPASGRTSLSSQELDELKLRLVSFAEFLYGGPVFKALYSLAPATLPPNVKAAFAITATVDNGASVFEYNPSACRFDHLGQEVDGSQYAVGLECFASDLLDFLRGRLPPSALMFGRICRWGAGREGLTQAIDRTIWTFGHPLRRQNEYLEFYRSILALEPQAAPMVKSRKEALRGQTGE
jgi:hypothetical protein